MEPLLIERDYFNRSLPEWLNLYPGKFALIKGETLVGTFDTDTAAVTEGARLFGSEPFLVRPIIQGDQTLNAPAYMLVILRANPTFITVNNQIQSNQ